MKPGDFFWCAGAATLLILASAWIPFIGPIFSLFAPLPFLYYSSKQGLTQGIKMTAATLFIIGVAGALSGFPQILFLAIEFSLLGLMISEIFRRDLSIGYTVLIGTIFMVLLGFTITSLVGFAKGIGPMDLIFGYLQNNLREVAQIYGEGGVDQGKDLQLQEYIRKLIEVMTRIYPALAMVGTGFVVWFNVIVSRTLFLYGKLPYPHFAPLDRWYAPEKMVWGLIIAGFSLFLPVVGIKFLALNLLIVLSAVYFFHGLSIVMFFLNKFRVPPWLRFAIYLLLLFQQIFVIGVATAGLFDQWLDFRKIHLKKGSL